MIGRLKEIVRSGSRHLLRSSMRSARVRRFVQSVINDEPDAPDPEREKHVRGYISARETIEAARRHNLSLCDYLEMTWDQKGDAERVINNMTNLGVFRGPIRKICEIGPGTGMFLEKTLGLCSPERYECYEPDEDWRKWVAGQYDVICLDADGKSLSLTPSSSIDLVHAHGVLVYVPFLTVCRYLREMVRVTRSGGHVVFDIMSEDCFDDDTVESWLQSVYNYPTFVSKQYVKDFFAGRGFSFLGHFFNRFGPGKSQYCVFRKQ